MRSARNTEVRGGLQHRHLVVRRLDAERAIDIGQVAGDTAQFADQQGDRSHIEDDCATHIDLGLMLDRDADPAVADPAHGAGDFERGEECRRHIAAEPQRDGRALPDLGQPRHGLRRDQRDQRPAPDPRAQDRREDQVAVAGRAAEHRVAGIAEHDDAAFGRVGHPHGVIDRGRDDRDGFDPAAGALDRREVAADLAQSAQPVEKFPPLRGCRTIRSPAASSAVD